MPRYFFDVHDGVDASDEDGTVLAGVAEAKIEAARFGAALLIDNPQRFWKGKEWIIRVRDERGLRLFEMIILSNDAPALYDQRD